MKIVDHKTFLALPAGTLFSKYTPISFGDLSIKGDTLPGDVGDFVSLTLSDAVDHTSSADLMDKLDAARTESASMPMDFDAGSRDGMFDADQSFAVWEPQDVFALIARLQSTLPGAEALAEKHRFASFDQVLHCDAVAHSVWRQSGSLGDVIVALANQKNSLIARIMELESIAPKKIALQDGRVAVWHCPTNLIPEAKA